MSQRIWKLLLPDEKVREVKRMARDGGTARSIADALGTMPGHVRTLARIHNITLNPHVSADTLLPRGEEEPLDAAQTEFNRRYAAWEKAVRGARQTRKLSTGYPQAAHVDSGAERLREAHGRSTHNVTTGQVSEANALSPANGAALQGGPPSTQALGALT